jgi:hypothetical protein
MATSDVDNSMPVEREMPKLSAPSAMGGIHLWVELGEQSVG